MLARAYANMSDYIIKEKIGQGSFGIVYRAIRKARGHHPEKECALKKILVNPDMNKFISEVKCHALLKHYAVLPLVGWTIPMGGAGDFCVISEFMPNGTLQQLIEKASTGCAPENWETIRSINIFGIAAGMAYVHQKNVIHRDLKTENVMLDSDYFPKIADFGLSKIFEEGTQDKINQTLDLGTPIYMAPELWDDLHYSNKIDVFAYALVLYELFTTRKPWDDKKNLTKFSIKGFLERGERPTISDREIPEVYVELIDHCWAGKPEDRPSFIEIVKGLIDFKDQYFNPDLLDNELLEDYMDSAIKGLDFSQIPNDE